MVRVLTHRLGGVSRGSHDGLNLGVHVGDDPADVAQNRAIVEDAVGMPVAYMDQVHGAEVVEVTDAVSVPTCRVPCLSVQVRPGRASPDAAIRSPQLA